MKREIRKVNPCLKKVYVPPGISVLRFNLEQGIAAGSAQVIPTDHEHDVKQNWEEIPDRDLTFEW